MSLPYIPTVIAGTVSQWKRANQVIAMSPLGGTPSCVFVEEIATQLPNGIFVTEPSTQIAQALTDMTLTFNLIDMTTGNVTGTMTYGQFVQATESFYLALAAARDAAVINTNNAISGMQS